MGNCATCDGQQLESANEHVPVGTVMTEGIQLSSRNNPIIGGQQQQMSVSKKPIQIRSNQKPLDGSAIYKQADKENVNNSLQQSQLLQGRLSMKNNDYQSVPAQTGLQSARENNLRNGSTTTANTNTTQPRFQRISSNPNELHHVVQALLKKVGDFEYNEDDSFDESQLEGPLLFDNGAVYYGELQNGLRHGRGKQIWKDGSFYEGNWQNDTAWGKGRLIHSDGDIYNGDWQQDRAHGKGTYYHSDGAQYSGDWFEDRQHGMGLETWPDNTSYKGEYVFGKKQGNGLFTWGDGSNYTGQFHNNEIEGTGIYKWSDGRVYNGQWVLNKMEGVGVFEWPDGRKYEGEYLDDKKEGYGAFKWPDGKVYQGYWQNGKQNGFGVIKFSDGQQRHGVWQNGKYVGIEGEFSEEAKRQQEEYAQIEQFGLASVRRGQRRNQQGNTLKQSQQFTDRPRNANNNNNNSQIEQLRESQLIHSIKQRE